MTKEKKPTDEEVIKALEICYNDIHCSVDCPYFNLNGRNFCQDKELYKDLKRIVLEHSEQKAEIERLTELQSRGGYRVAELSIENAELQKQVNGLTEEKERMQIDLDNYHKIWKEKLEENYQLQKKVDELKEKQVIECHGMLKDCDLVKQSVKDTAREIYTQVLEWLPVGEDYSVFIHNIEQWLKEKYGVEVE